MIQRHSRHGQCVVTPSCQLALDIRLESRFPQRGARGKECHWGLQVRACMGPAAGRARHTAYGNCQCQCAESASGLGSPGPGPGPCLRNDARGGGGGRPGATGNGPGNPPTPHCSGERAAGPLTEAGIHDPPVPSPGLPESHWHWRTRSCQVAGSRRCRRQWPATERGLPALRLGLGPGSGSPRPGPVSGALAHWSAWVQVRAQGGCAHGLRPRQCGLPLSAPPRPPSLLSEGRRGSESASPRAT